MDHAVSWNSELPSGRNPFWVRDDAMAPLGLRRGEAVSVDTRREPADGDLVAVEVEVDDESLRTIRRYFRDRDHVRLAAADLATPELRVHEDALIVMGVVYGRLRFETRPDGLVAVEEPI